MKARSSQFISISQCNGPNGPHRKESSSSDLQTGSINDSSPNEGREGGYDYDDMMMVFDEIR